MAASEQEILAALTEIIQEHSSAEVSQVTPEATFTGDLDVDSLALMSIVLDAEDRFGVRIPDADLASLVTVGDAVGFIEKARS